MANIQLYIFQGSPPCHAVMLTAKALGVPLELKQLDFMTKEQLSPEFTQINPDHTVPTIIDGDFILWESRAIMRYLVGKYGGEDNSLYPRGLQKRAEVDRLLDYDLGVFYRTLLENVWRPARDRTEKTKEQEEQIVKALARIDTLVKDKKYLTGNDITIADFAMVVGFAIEFVYRGDKTKYPNAMTWYKRMQELPYFKEVNQSFFDLVEQFKIGQDEKS
ncbi:glutathione S-transferase 1-like isoform X1 [Haliotis rufescens]|uniref:glutathione S-transferase 1-like isoform X1 n=1 Tax=Haliotis rufescens TaxID=6454 RepID=UPI00201EC97D|nr:glutathione S-transferase 1-like isoform X1 [Haliotis rufescens]